MPERADDRDELAGVDLERHSVERAEGAGIGDVVLDHVAQVDEHPRSARVHLVADCGAIETVSDERRSHQAGHRSALTGPGSPR